MAYKGNRNFMNVIARSLRRSNLVSSLDCFAPLAMTPTIVALTIVGVNYMKNQTFMRNLNKRDDSVLSMLITEFIASGRPIGSKTIAKDLSDRFSSATIRNIMADLEEGGLLTHTHTSSGRLPTDKGIRYYIDRLLEIEPISAEKLHQIKGEYRDTSYNVSALLQKTSRILSGLSNYAGLVVAPTMSEIVIKHMEFIPLSRGKVLGIFVGQNGIVENRVIKVSDECNYLELEKISNYCNRAFYSLTLSDAKRKASAELVRSQKEYDEIISRALQLSDELFLSMEASDLFVDGSAQLLDMPKASDVLEAIEEKKRVIDLLNNAMEGSNVNIFIGSESGYSAFQDCSVVSASYKKDGRVLGSLGVIGPTRMNYSKVIPIVDCTARLIGDLLSGEEMV